MTLQKLVPAALLLASSSVQGDTPPSGPKPATVPSAKNALFNATFSVPMKGNDCNKHGDGNPVTFSLRKLPEAFTCFNMDDTFTHPDKTYSTTGYTCNPGTTCGANYTITGASHYQTGANYSQIWYQAIESVGEGGDNDHTSPTVFSVFAAENCMQGNTADGTGVLPWYR